MPLPDLQIARARRVLGRRFRQARSLWSALPATLARLADPQPPRPATARQNDVPPLQLFTDIEVVPSRAFYHMAQMVDGGPVWPEFDTQTAARHLRNGTPIDRNAQPVAGRHRLVTEPCLWGGYAHRHFGHLVSEHLTRLPAALHHRPRDKVLFVARPEQTADGLPGHFWSLLDWYGLPHGQVEIVTRPLRVAELRVAAQGEYLDRCTPEPFFLDLLDENARRNRLVPIPNDMLYVSRLGMLAEGTGSIAGELALVRALQRCGVTVMDPGAEPLMRQLALYAGARVLVFAEGSAQHGRQLLGRIDQQIVVLRRRPEMSMGKFMLEPRCTSIHYAPTARSIVPPLARDGGALHPRAISFFDLSQLFTCFRKLGIPLGDHWDRDTYRQAREADAAAWLAALPRLVPKIDVAKTMAQGRTAFLREGLGHLLAPPPGRG